MVLSYVCLFILFIIVDFDFDFDVDLWVGDIDGYFIGVKVNDVF